MSSCASAGSVSCPTPGRRRNLLSTGVAASLFVPTLLSAGGGPVRAAVQVLPFDRSIEGEVAGRPSRSYRVTLAAGQFLDVVWQLRGTSPVRSRLLGPDGERLLERNGAESEGRDGFMWIAEQAGDYRVELAAVAPDMPSAPYSIRLVALRPATAEDRVRLQADGLCREAHRLSRGTERSMRQAIDTFQKSLDLWQRVDDKAMETDTLLWMGLVYHGLGENTKALEAMEKGLRGAQAAGNRVREASALNDIGAIYSNSYELDKALDYLRRAQAVMQAAGIPDSGATLHNIAGIQHALGEWQQALDSFHQALQIVRDQRNRANEAAVLNSIGLLYENMGEYQRAIDHYQRALLLKQAEKDLNGQAITLVALVEAYYDMGEKEKALPLIDRALRLLRQTGSRRFEASALRSQARIHHDQREFKKSVEEAQRSLALTEEFGELGAQALSLNLMGLSRAALGETEEARECFRRAVDLFHDTGDRREEVRTLYELARLEHDHGRTAEARAHVEGALQVVESLRTKVASPALRASYFAAVQKHHELYIDILMGLHREDPRAGHDAAAFEVSERARARSLLELVGESRADIRQGVDQELIEEEKRVSQRLDMKTEALMRLRGLPGRERESAALAREIESAYTELDRLEARIRQESPRYAALVHPQPLGLRAIQAEVLDPDTVLLQYALGEKRSFLWVVTPTALTGHELPGRDEIVALVRRTQHALSRPGGAAAARAAQGGPEALAALGRVVLGPARSAIEGKRLVVVTDDALHYVPFAALPVDEAGAPLIVDHEIVTPPSASVLSVLRRERRERPSPGKVLAMFADPVFENDDERVPRPRARIPRRAPVAQGSGRERSLRAAREAGLPPGSWRLPFSGGEARRILSLVPPGDRKEAIGLAATRAAATSPDLAEYRFVHFATHGFVNDQRPELSGLLLSLVDGNGQEQDGLLSAADIYNLRLSAELVVLSGCRTGLGREIRGEGLVGLGRAFMYAGAAQVMASLWNVDDRATAGLMKRFYEEMIVRHASPAAALRAAQREMLAKEGWRAPYYWSGFVVLGDWK
jgi:CHAT domain-containing protein/tetratricopeptide (TPR) repeat protein